jgi:hypothetical protein
LANVDRDRDDLATLVRLLQPGDDAGRVEDRRIGEADLLGGGERIGPDPRGCSLGTCDPMPYRRAALGDADRHLAERGEPVRQYGTAAGASGRASVHHRCAFSHAG